MKFCKLNRISLWANEKIFMNANRMEALKLLTGQSLTLIFCLRFEFMSRNVLNNKSAIAWTMTL